MKREIVALLVAVVLLVSACQGQQAITDAFLRDTIFSIEPRANGTATIWVTHDDVGSYCTRDSALITKAHTIFVSDNPEAVIEYRTVNANDPEWTWLGGVGGGCAIEKGGHTTYLVLNIFTVAEYRDR